MKQRNPLTGSRLLIKKQRYSTKKIWNTIQYNSSLPASELGWSNALSAGKVNDPQGYPGRDWYGSNLVMRRWFESFVDPQLDSFRLNSRGRRLATKNCGQQLNGWINCLSRRKICRWQVRRSGGDLLEWKNADYSVVTVRREKQEEKRGKIELTWTFGVWAIHERPAWRSQNIWHFQLKTEKGNWGKWAWEKR